MEMLKLLPSIVPGLLPILGYLIARAKFLDDASPVEQSL
jgi:hypothetical protein